MVLAHAEQRKGFAQHLVLIEEAEPPNCDWYEGVPRS